MKEPKQSDCGHISAHDYQTWKNERARLQSVTAHDLTNAARTEWSAAAQAELDNLIKFVLTNTNR